MTSWTSPTLGRPSPASGTEPSLRPAGDSASAAWRADGAGTGWCVIRAATVVGVRHRLAGQASDDSYAWAHAPGALMMAVADGVGSVPGSSGAADRACRAAVDAGLAAWAAADDPSGAVREGIQAGELAAAEGGGATTLVVAALLPDGTVSVGRVGDSTAFLLDGAHAAELFDPPDPDRTDAVTAALPGGAADAEVGSFTMSGAGILVLATDGVADPWRDGPTTVAPALVAALGEHPGPLQLLSVTDFSRQGCHDDRTVLCAWLTPGG